MNLKFIHDSREKYVKIGKNLVKLQQLLDSQFTFWATIGRAVSKKETAKPM